MNNIFQKGQNILDKYIGFFFLAVILLWMKTYIVQLTQFDLGIENSIQQFLLFINPLGSSLLFLGFAFFFKGRKKYIWLIIIDFLLSFLLYANVLYYRFFNDFITLPTLTQTQNFGDVSSSVVSLLKPYDFLFFVDIHFVNVVTCFSNCENRSERYEAPEGGCFIFIGFSYFSGEFSFSRNRSSSIINKRI